MGCSIHMSNGGCSQLAGNDREHNQLTPLSLEAGTVPDDVFFCEFAGRAELVIAPRAV